MDPLTGWFINRLVETASHDPSNALLSRTFQRVDYTVPEIAYSGDASTSTHLDIVDQADRDAGWRYVHACRIRDPLEMRLSEAIRYAIIDADLCSRPPSFHPHAEMYNRHREGVVTQWVISRVNQVEAYDVPVIFESEELAINRIRRDSNRIFTFDNVDNMCVIRCFGT